MSENYDETTDGPVTYERAKHHLRCLRVDCEWRACEVDEYVNAQAKLLADFGRHVYNTQQDICENAFVEVSVYDAVKQALSEVAPDHPALRNEPPNYGVWENQRKRIDELEATNAELRAANDELRKQNHILDLSVQLEEDLQDRAYDLLARMHLPQGWSVVEVAQLIIDMQKRIAADWVKVGNLMNKAYPPF